MSKRKIVRIVSRVLTLERKSLFFFALIFSLSLPKVVLGHTDSNISYQYGQVMVSIKTGVYNRVQEDVKLFGRLLNTLCTELGIKDTIHIDFIHEYSCMMCTSTIMFSKSEPFGYLVQYNGDENFTLLKDNYSDSLNAAAIQSTIRIRGSQIELREALIESILFLFYQNELTSSDYKDLFSGWMVYKSVFTNSSYKFYGRKENKKLLSEIDLLLSNKNWLDSPNPDYNFVYYFQDSTYYIVHKKDSTLIDFAQRIYSLEEGKGWAMNSYLFVFSSPFQFTVTEFSESILVNDSIVVKEKKHIKINDLTETDLGLFGSWSVSRLFSEVFLLDHSDFWQTVEGPFVVYDAKNQKIILTEK